MAQATIAQLWPSHVLVALPCTLLCPSVSRLWGSLPSPHSIAASHSQWVNSSGYWWVSFRERQSEESFFVRHAYFRGANDPYSALKTTLKAEIDRQTWDTLNSDSSRPFDKPKSGRVTPMANPPSKSWQHSGVPGSSPRFPSQESAKE